MEVDEYQRVPVVPVRRGVPHPTHRPEVDVLPEPGEPVRTLHREHEQVDKEEQDTPSPS